MRILHTVESYLPAIGGMQEVVRQLSERLVGLGHAVTVATRMHPDRTDKTPGGVQVVEFDLSGNAVKGIQGDAERYKQFLLDSDFDIFTNFAAQQWATDLALPLLKQIKGKKVSVPTGFSGLYDPDYSGYFEQMKTWMKDYDTNVFLSDNYRDIQFARENGITKNVLIPNGAGADEFLAPSALNIRKKLGLGPTEFLALHVGSYTGIKGQKEAVEIFLSSDIQQGTLLLVGFQNDYFKNVYERKWAYRWLRFRNRQKNKKVLITQLSRAETVAAYKEADLFLFPSRMECSPIVLFESMASKTPFLTTDAGNAAEIISWSGGGLMLPTQIDKQGYSRADIGSSAQMLDALYADKEKMQRLAENGFRAWEKKFSWEIIARQYETLYHNLLQK